jgi:4-alpha-glucanotransferase
MMTVDENLAALAAAHGVATHYENADRQDVTVDEDVVVAVLGQLGVAAGTPESVRAELDAVRAARRAAVLPPTVVLRSGTERTFPGSAVLDLEDGSCRRVDGVLPADLPLGYHRISVENRTSTLIVVPDRLPDPPPAWGWMLQLYALHSAGSWGIGDFADLATITDRSATELGAGVLLVNPVQAIGPTHPVERSPYSPSSRRFVNPVYLRIEATEAYRAADAPTRAAVDALRPDPDDGLIDYDRIWDAKLAALDLLWSAGARSDAPDDPELAGFATFCALAEEHGPDWRCWPEPAPAAVPDRVAFHTWLQELCRAQLAEVRRTAHEAGMAVGVIHDLPVGVSPGGADTWSAREAFAAEVTVGAPPDAFSPRGQDWNLPPWRPDRLAELGYAPLRDMLRRILAHADGVRVDHIAGLWRLWWIPPGESPNRGTYVHYDAEAMVGVLTLEAHRAGAVVVGEDLGTVEPEVTATMHERGILSSAVLWFQRDWEADGQPFVPPQRWDPETMASISTHDLPTALSWLTGDHVHTRADLGLLDDPDQAAMAAEEDRAAMFALFTAQGVGEADLVVALHTVLASAASRFLLTAPTDALGELRQPNLPGTIDQYPNWRIPLPVPLERLLTDERVLAALAPLRAARLPVGTVTPSRPDKEAVLRDQA